MILAAHLKHSLQDDFNKEPWGEDASDRMYWLHDLGDGRGLRLCREDPPAEPSEAKEEGPRKGGKKGAAKGGKSKKRAREDLVGGRWHTVATSIDEIEEVCAHLVCSCTPTTCCHALMVCMTGPPIKRGPCGVRLCAACEV